MMAFCVWAFVFMAEVFGCAIAVPCVKPPNFAAFFLLIVVR
jgi:hypothetical protein